MTTSSHDQDALRNILNNKEQPFALLYRPESKDGQHIDALIGEVEFVEALSDISLPEPGPAKQQVTHDKLVLLPYKQLAERGFEATDDGTPLVSMSIKHQDIYSLEQILSAIPDTELELQNADFTLSDQEYASLVKNILSDEIGQGKGASFVLQRTFVADLANDHIDNALTIFRKLLTKQSGSYWIFIVNSGERVLVGATPERHITLDQGTAMMNPISGTYRYPASGPNLPELLSFLGNKKEADELYMVVDEELKMMTRICDSGVQVKGPMLKEMAFVAHTEYFIQGQSNMDPITILKETMFAPSVTGSPIESAARVIRHYEPEGRGYYSGVIGLISRENGQYQLDSSILIRTADIDKSGKLQLSVGATLVRGSDPLSEAQETKAKASGLLAALGVKTKSNYSHHPDVLEVLNSRNQSIGDFWLTQKQNTPPYQGQLSGKKILIVDEEDTFSFMIKHQLCSLNCEVVLRRFDEDYSFDDQYDLIIMGPGPGDPNHRDDPKIAKLFDAIQELLTTQKPFLAVCLSHQVLSILLGLNVVRRDDPNQGVQKEIELFEQTRRVGFYNTFSARYDQKYLPIPGTVERAEVSFDPIEKEVHALRGNLFHGIQFHPESILTVDGVDIFANILTRLLTHSIQHKQIVDKFKAA